MARELWHRWNHDDPGARPGRGIPDAGDVIVGRRHRWRVLEVRPIDSRKHPAAWRGRLEQLGPHGLDGAALVAELEQSRWYYRSPTMPPGFRDANEGDPT
jgi:hypothetical protein